MSIYKLTFKQSKDLIYNNKTARIKRGGAVYYVSDNDGEPLAVDWLGLVVHGVKFVYDDMFID